MFGWDPERVVVENKLVGGGFGGKEDVSAQHIAALAAVKSAAAGKGRVFPAGVHQFPSEAPRHGRHVHAGM